MPHIDTLKESKFLQKHDVDPDVLVTINGNVYQENVAMEDKPEDLKWAIKFHELEKPMILNSTNQQLIAQIVGSKITEDWDGKQVVLYHEPNISYQGKLTGGIRIRAPKKRPALAEMRSLREEDEEV